MLDVLDKFVTVKAGEFVFKFSAESAPVLTPYAVPLAQAAYKEYSERYGFKPQGPIYIEVFDQHDSFAVRTVGLPGIVGALGACFGRVIAMDSPKARPPGDFSWQATMWHEIAHVFTLQLSNYRVPRWLTEGLSQYEEHRRSAPWGRELTMQYARLMAQGETFTLKQLGESFKTNRIAMAYFEASLLAEHLEGLGGTAALRTLLTAYADGANDTDALTKAFGKTVPEIETSFRAFTDQRFGALRDALKDPATKVADDDLAALKARAEAQPKSYISQMQYGTAAMQAQQVAEAKAAFEKAAALAPAAGGDDGPFAMLATIAGQAGDKATARKYLRHVLDYQHDNLSAARTLAARSLEAGLGADIDFALTRIADLDPFDGDAHTQLGRRELAQGRADRAIIEFAAALALGPPNLADAHTDLGEAYLKVGPKDDAKREAFIALEQAPTFARAQDLLLAALGKAGQ
jgi:tetratricopeptide (TPR) repeat protein